MTEPRELEKSEGEGDETLVTPRFDEEETVLAQPVVPIEADAASAGPAPHPVTAAPYAHMRRAQWPLALILISALAGSVVGGTALYFFQKHRRAGAPAAAPASQPAEATQPQPAPTAEQEAEQAAEVEPAAPAPVIESAEPAEAPAADVSQRDDDKRGDDIPAPAPPPVADTGATKPNRKAENEDDEPRRRERREDREARDDRDDDARPSGRGGREARRVDSIVYPSRREQRREERREQRRAERRERRAARNVDRVRAIFEGQP